MRAIAVDWSGAASGDHKHIWLAEAVEPGRLVRLEAGRERTAVAAHLCQTLREPVAIGLDFAFSFPAWFMRGLGVSSAPDLWECVRDHGEEWLSSCEPPFWGRPGRPRPATKEDALRRTDLAVPRTAGIAPKSIFQIGGAGAVGTGSIRGMPTLTHLHTSGARVWPFTEGALSTVVEIYPRLMTGPVHKSNPSARAALLTGRYPRLSEEHRHLASVSEDAFDAAVSALVMVEHLADIATLPAESDPVLRVEGRIWHPNWRADPL